MNWAATLWFALMLVFLVVEAACPIHLVSLWFAAGALVAAIIGLFHGAAWIQITAFLVVSGGLLAALWPFVKKFLKPRLSATNVDSILGTEGYVTAAIDNVSATGQIKLGGMCWSARSTGGQPIPEGTLVRVDKIEGVKAFVTPAKEEVTA